MSFKPSRRGTLTAVSLLALLLCLPAAGKESTEAVCDGALADKLHEKGILSDQEYEEIKQTEESRTRRILRSLTDVDIGVLSFIDFSGGERKDGDSYSRFTITRGYIDIRKDLVSWLGVRVTPDVHQDAEGDFKFRLKYLYADFRIPDLGFLTGMHSEVGIGHMPWLDFEEHINPYRVQGTMFLERAGIFNSADIGVSIRGGIGGRLGPDYRKRVASHYADRWGSWHIGVYNGGGYHAKEDNGNKVPEWRLSIRPFPDSFPGLQFHYFGLYGEGNKENISHHPDYRVHLGMVSYQNAWVVLTGQYARTTGNNKGSLVVPGTDRALRGEGFSVFARTRLPLFDRKLSWFVRYDRYDPDRTDLVTSGDAFYNLVHTGLAWEFFRRCMVILVYERVLYDENNGGLGKAPEAGKDLEDDWRVQTALQLKF